MAKLIAKNPQKVKLKTSGYIGQPEGNIDLTENNVQVNVAPYKYATPKIPIQEDVPAVNPSAEEQTIVPDIGYEGMKSVKVNPANLESKRVTPTTEEQTIVPQSPAIGFSQFTVEPVTPSIDPDIQPENIKQGVDILGVQGTLKPPVLIEKTITENGTYAAEDDNADGYSEVDVNIPPPVLERGSAIPKATAETYIPQGAGFSDFTVEATPLEAKTVTPTSQQQVVTPTAPNIGLSSVTVEAPSEALKNINLDAYIQGDLTDIVFNGTKLDDMACFSRNISSIEIPNVITIGRYSLSATRIKTIKFPSSLVSINVLAFQSCSLLETVDLSEVFTVITLGASAFNSTTCTFLFRDQAQLDAYAAATNWSALASRFQIKTSGV